MITLDEKYRVVLYRIRETGKNLSILVTILLTIDTNLSTVVTVLLTFFDVSESHIRVAMNLALTCLPLCFNNTDSKPAL